MKDLKELLFEKTYRTRVSLQTSDDIVAETILEGEDGFYESTERNNILSRFMGFWDLIEECELVDEYETYLNANGYNDEIQ